MIGGNPFKMLMLLSFLLICLDSASTQYGKFLVHDDNESAYRDLLNVTLSQYNEDLNNSSRILAEYVKKNITAREAMVATMSLYTLTSKTEDEFHKAKATNKYKNIHNNTCGTLQFRGVLMEFSEILRDR
jgi:hypothetical protein